MKDRIVLSITILFFIAFIFSIYDYRKERALENTEDVLGRELPHDSKNVFFKRVVISEEAFLGRFIQMVWYIKFESRYKNNVVAWVNEICSPYRIVDDFNPLESSEQEGWWNPQIASYYPHAGAKCGGINILVVYMSVDKIQVYILTRSI